MSNKINNIVPRITAIIISFIITAITVCTTYNCGASHEKNIRFVCIFIMVCWLIIFIKSSGLNEYTKLQISIFVMFAIVIGIYLSVTIWHSGYLTNIPIAAINGSIGGIHNDSLFHTSIAQAIRYYGTPSFLVNSSAFYNYHFGSHAVMALFSFLFDIPAYFVYCYLYPAFFLPLYVYLIFAVGSELKFYLFKISKLTIFDFIFVMCFILPILAPKPILDMLADPKSSWIISESYMVANVFALLFFKIFFWANRRRFFDNRLFLSAYMFIVIPLFLILTSLSKISVGFFLFAGITYYLVRKFTSNKKAWFLSIYYTIWFFVIYFLPGVFFSPFKSNTNFTDICFFNFLDSVVGDRRLWGIHTLAYFFFAAFFLFYRLKNEENIFEAIRSKRYLIEEILFLICIVGIIPGNIFVIKGGSAFYFATVQQLVAIILIIGYDIPNKIFINYDLSKFIVKRFYVLILVLSLGWNTFYCTYIGAKILIDDCSLHSYQYQESQKKGTYWEQISYINQLSQNDKKDYYLYINEDAAIWKFYENRDSAMHFYPAMTGIVTIGALYYDDGQMYYNSGEPYTSGWYKPNPEETRMTYDDALEKAERDGKKGLFYVHKDTVDYISFD